MRVIPLHEYEAAYIVKVLNHFGGSRVKTAKALKISVRGLYEKLLRAEYLGHYVQPSKFRNYR